MYIFNNTFVNNSLHEEYYFKKNFKNKKHKKEKDMHEKYAIQISLTKSAKTFIPPVWKKSFKNTARQNSNRSSNVSIATTKKKTI